MQTAVVGMIGVVLVSITAWLSAATQGEPPGAGFTPHPVAEVRVHPDVRLAALARATTRVSPSIAAISPAEAAPLECAFLAEPPSGTTPKFSCVLRGGEIVKVKYGRNPEIHAEAAATALLTRLGYPADQVTIVPSLRCYGCPRYPYLSNKLHAKPWLAPLLPQPGNDAFTDFEQVSIEHKFPAPALETTEKAGWGWWELKYSVGPRAELDALRLLAVFLAHWDNKAENQRLVCEGSGVRDGKGSAGDCTRPLLMIQDLGATFGPYKVNLAEWQKAPIWEDARTCRISMRTFPFGGATFPPAQIGEAGRLQLLSQLESLDATDIRSIFEQAQFHAYYAGTDDDRDLDAWTETFQRRVRMIAAGGPCN